MSSSKAVSAKRINIMVQSAIDKIYIERIAHGGKKGLFINS